MSKEHFNSDFFNDITKVIFLNLLGLSVSLASVEQWLKIIALLLTCTYTGYKIFNERKNKKANE